MNETNNHTPDISTDVESDNTKNAPHETLRNGLFNKAVSITFHSIRRRETDVDGSSVKAAIDGMVEAGILGGDRLKHVKKVSQTEELTKDEEKTIITITDD